ncbi:MAG: response regulator [Polyangiaceae bacterium]|nr:response regulator [Polyangiaceae bacterium]
MKAPELPPSEAQRLEALRSYEVLDSDAVDALDSIAELAARLLDVPIALVSLVDSDRQWFKGRFGLDIEQTGRDVSFCGHVVAGDAPLVVSDAREDDRFADNPLVTGEPRIRFYAGVPLRTPDGFTLGTLCAIDQRARSLSAKESEALTLLASLVVDQLQLRRKRIRLARAHVEAAEHAQRLEVLFDAMAEGVVVQNREGTISAANRSAERILGLTLDQISGRTSLDPRWRAVRQDGSPFPGSEHPAMVTLATGVESRNVVMGVHKTSGELSWISVNSLPLRSESEALPHAAITTFHDITAIKEAQEAGERIARQEHLLTTGTLASGVGHEINNPLTFLLANLELALEEVRAIGGESPSPRVDALVGILGDARQGGERIRRIVRGLRALARQETEPAPSAVDAAIDISLSIAAHELRNRAQVTTELAPTPLVLADESRLSQVLVNLLVNAAQAFPSDDPSRNRIVVSSCVLPDGRVAIDVKDNGPGVPPSIRHRIFDPFFTTKSVGQGTGLGLSICKSISTSLDGELTMKTDEITGTTFRLALPVAPAAARLRGAPSSVPTSGRGRILVVDDELAVLAAIGRTLEKEHEVVTASDPREALARIERGELFDVVFCDLTMPHLSGQAVYERVRERSPSLAERFVFISGGASDPKVQAFLAAVPNERVDKPFNIQSLRGLTRRLVTEAQRS